MSFALPPIVKLAESLLLDIERAAARFSRSHRYAYGADLRAQAYRVTLAAHEAWRDRAHQAQHIAQLVREVDGLKLRLQIGSRLHAFNSFGQFEGLARAAASLGRQTGAWHRQQQHPKGQNVRHSIGGQRAQILSSCATPSGVNP
jgi:hypothetical protein